MDCVDTCIQELNFIIKHPGIDLRDKYLFFPLIYDTCTAEHNLSFIIKLLQLSTIGFSKEDSCKLCR